MADGFALRGFTQGFTQGLQNIDQLATNWQARDLKQKGYELEQQQQERANRYNDYLIKNMERDNNRLDRQQEINERSAGLDKATKELSLQKQQIEMERQQRKDDLNRLYSVISPENPEDISITDEDVARMNRLGLRPFADYDPNKIKTWTDMLAKGEFPSDPEAMRAINDAYTVKAQRQLGRGITPGQQYTATGAETGEAVPRPGEQVMPAVKTVVGMKAVDGGYVPIVRVEGATAGPEKRYVSYEAPYTQNGMASPEDKPVRFTPQQMADTLRGAGFVSARLQANPALLERLRGQVIAESRGIPEAPSVKDQWYARDKKSQIENRALVTEAKVAVDNERAALLKWQQTDGDEKRKALIEYEAAKKASAEAQAKLYDAKTITEEGRAYKLGADTYNTINGKPGLGSAGKGGKPPAFKQKDVMARAKILFPSSADAIKGSPVEPDTEKRRFDFFNEVQTLVVDSRMDQEQAMSLAQHGKRIPQPITRKSDNRQFMGIEVLGEDGKPYYVPIKWLN